MRLIVSGDDGSEGAERAVAFAADVARLFDAKLLIAHVSEENLTQKQLAQLEHVQVSEGDALEEISRRTLRRARDIAKERGVADIDTATAIGDPAGTLLELAKSKRADAIVVGRRGRGRLKGLLLGGVSQKLASLASCAVIVVP